MHDPVTRVASISKAESVQFDCEQPSHTFLHSKPACKVTGSYGTCQCSCIGWVEVYIRRPTGNVSWIMEVDTREDSALSAFPDLSMYASSLSYLELYKKLCKYYNTLFSLVLTLCARQDN